MRRRELVELLCAGLIALPLSSVAETPMARVAVLRELPLSNSQVAQGWQIFVDALAKSGWIEGRNVEFIHRATGGRAGRYRELAAELVALNPNVVVTINSEATKAAREKTQDYPDRHARPRRPCRSGVHRKFCPPGGNITGVSSQLGDTVGKQLQIIKELRPNALRIAIFWRPDNPGSQLGKQGLEAAARGLGLAVEPTIVTTEGSRHSPLRYRIKPPRRVDREPPPTGRSAQSRDRGLRY